MLSYRFSFDGITGAQNMQRRPKASKAVAKEILPSGVQAKISSLPRRTKRADHLYRLLSPEGCKIALCARFTKVIIFVKVGHNKNLPTVAKYSSSALPPT